MTFKEKYVAPEVLSLELSPEGPIAFSGRGDTEYLDEQSIWEGGWL